MKLLFIKTFIFLWLFLFIFLAACEKNEEKEIENPSNEISIDSLVATFLTVKAWDTTTITCYTKGLDLEYFWECDHGTINGGGDKIKYAAGECCVGLNTITCIISNETGQATKNIQIDVTSYFGGGK